MPDTDVCSVGTPSASKLLSVPLYHHRQRLYDSHCMQVGSSNLRASTSLDTPGSPGLQFELNNLRNELRAKQQEHSETEEEVKPCCHGLHSTLT